ncbi:MAG: S-layer homology domain-containing protein, partial [Clostridia bacterium]|nr:S-layer homology domain-containing protein [Clostridia bacterium]
TNSSYASEASDPCAVTTLKAAQAAPDALTAADLTVTADSITVNVATGYEYAISTNPSDWSANGIFANLLPNTQYQVFARLAETNSAYASEASAPCTVTTRKGTQAAPAALTAADLTVATNSIKVKSPVEGYEYACTTKDAGVPNEGWSKDGNFTGLSTVTAYDIYVRAAETDTLEASAASEACSVTTKSRPSSGSNRPSSGSSSSDEDTPKTETVTNSDGSKTTTKTYSNGTVIETTKYSDGSSRVVETKRDGTVTTTETDAEGNITQTVEEPDGTVVTTETTKDGTVTETIENTDGTCQITVVTPDGTIAKTMVDEYGTADVTVRIGGTSGTDGAVTLPITALEPNVNSMDADSLTIKTSDGAGEATVTIPVTNIDAGTVVVIVNPDGTETILRDIVVGDESVTITVPDGTKLKLIDNAKEFSDVSDNSWFKDAVDFASSHELFNGTSDTTFTPDSTMTRGMLAQVLHNLANNPDAGNEEGFTDVSGDQYYSEAAAWAAEQGIINGYGDGQFGAEDAVTREQLAALLYRYAGQPAVDEGSELSNGDAGEVSTYAEPAMRWAVENGIITGDTKGNLMPKSDANRAQVASMLMRFCKNV